MGDLLSFLNECLEAYRSYPLTLGLERLDVQKNGK
jgi:hypothetical protein